MTINKDINEMTSPLAKEKFGRLLHTIATADEAYNIGDKDTQKILDALSEYIAEVASDCYAAGFNDGAKVGMKRGQQKGEQSAAEKMVLAFAPGSGTVN